MSVVGFLVLSVIELVYAGGESSWDLLVHAFCVFRHLTFGKGL